MNQAGRAAKKISPAARVAAAGLTVGAAGVWAWRRKSPTAVPERETSAEKKDGTPTPAPTPAPDAQMQRTGPMVAVYLDNESVEKLHQEYPGTKPGRLRKVVIQYNPSADQRSSYEKYFGGSATVKLTGEAYSENRLALMASVSSAGDSVEPLSLSCAVDVTPGDVGGGPLGSTVLIEQIKRAGALTEESWTGSLPALSAHERDFPSEEGSYNKLDEPLTLAGTICRADWVEGKTALCRTKTAGGGKREDGWTPRGCINCNTFEASPCRDIFKIFDSLAERQNELQPPTETKSPSAETKLPESPSESSPPNSSGASSAGGDDDERGVPKTESTEHGDKSGLSDDKADNAIPNGNDGEGKTENMGKDGKGGTTQESGEEQDSSEKHQVETEEEKLRREELEMLKDQRNSLMLEMVMCSEFYHVFDDALADDGLVPPMPDDEVEGGADATAEKGSGAEEGGRSGTASEDEKKTKEDGAGRQPPIDKSAEK